MRSFVFENKTYTNLNDLGLAFKQSYQEALKAISTKPFLKFLKKQKKLYRRCGIFYTKPVLWKRF